MFSGVLIGILAGLSVSTWIYTKTMRRTGSNNQSSLITGAIAGVFTFIIVVTIVAMIDSYLAK